MEHPDVKEQLPTSPAAENSPQAPAAAAARPVASSLTPQECPTCGVAPVANSGPTVSPSYVYAKTGKDSVPPG
jgi:hypothetical protein